MSRDADVVIDGPDMVVRGELHTKCVTPWRLSRELKELAGQDAQFKVEMRHNVYNIECSKPFDLDELRRNCQGLHRKKSACADFEGVLITPSQVAEST